MLGALSRNGRLIEGADNEQEANGSLCRLLHNLTPDFSPMGDVSSMDRPCLVNATNTLFEPVIFLVLSSYQTIGFIGFIRIIGFIASWSSWGF